METRAFAPLYGPFAGTTAGGFAASTTVAATNSAATASTAFAGGTNSGSYQLQIANKSSAWAHVNLGVVGALVAATVAASYPVAPGGVVVVTCIAPEVNGASVILDAAPSGTGNVVFTRGIGL